MEQTSLKKAKQEPVIQYIFIGGGTSYHGSTANRDRMIALQFGYQLDRLCARHGSDMEIRLVYGGQEGIPEDCLTLWNGRVEILIAKKHADAREQRRPLNPDKDRMHILGERERDRRERFAKYLPYACGFFIQGGPYTADEIKRLMIEKVPIVPFVGSGGAAGSEIEIEDDHKHDEFIDVMANTITRCPMSSSTSPNASPETIATELAKECFMACLNNANNNNKEKK